MRLRAPVTRGYFFLLGALRLVNAASPRNIDQKKISSGTQGTQLLMSIIDLISMQPICEPTFLAPHHSWIIGLRIVFFDQSQPNLNRAGFLVIGQFCDLAIYYGRCQLLAEKFFVITFRLSFVTIRKCDE